MTTLPHLSGHIFRQFVHGKPIACDTTTMHHWVVMAERGTGTANRRRSASTLHFSLDPTPHGLPCRTDETKPMLIWAEYAGCPSTASRWCRTERFCKTKPMVIWAKFNEDPVIESRRRWLERLDQTKLMAIWEGFASIRIPVRGSRSCEQI